MFSDIDSRTKTGGSICLLLTIISCYLTSQTDSLSLNGSTWLNIFAFFAIISSITANKKWSKRNSHYTYGYTRAPVMAVFATSLLAQLFSVFLIKESFEHLLGGHGDSVNHQEHHEEHEEHGNEHMDHDGKYFYFLCSMIVTSISLLVSTYTVIGRPFHHVLQVSSASSLQEHASDISQAICYVVPGLSRLLLPRINSMILLIFVNNICSLFTLVFGSDFEWCDPVATIVLSIGVFSTTMPLSSYTGKILLQTTSPHILNQIDRCISEASTVEGVLELKSAQFWQLDFSQIAGSVDVRVRRDANDQMVLALVTEKLNNIVNILTVEIVKDSSTSWGTMYQSSNILVEGGKIDCRFSRLNVITSSDGTIKGPEFCDAKPGDELSVICNSTDTGEIVVDESSLHWKVNKGNINIISITSKATMNITNKDKDIELLCYGNEEHIPGTITIKINHKDKLVKEKKIAARLKLENDVIILSISLCVLFIMDIVTFCIFLTKCCSYKSLKAKEQRIKKLRLMISRVNMTLSEMDEPKKNSKIKDNRLSSNLEKSKNDKSKGAIGSKPIDNSVDSNVPKRSMVSQEANGGNFRV